MAERSGVALERVDAILSLFSVTFGEPQDPVKLVKNFLDGQNPFTQAALLADKAGNYITVALPIGTDCFRQAAEAALKSTSAWSRYDKHRAAATEELAVGFLESLLDVPAAHANVKYFRPKPGVELTALGSGAQEITSLGDEVEADALFLVEDVAVCVEVKARSVTSGARQGHVLKLANDLKKTVGEATEQAIRLETLIDQNHGLWLGDKTWLDLSHIREVRSIAVCLDDMGPLGTALDELVRSNVIQESRFPWIVSLHDLAIVSEVLDRPAEFLLYLRRRTESDVSMLYHAVDELDLFMLFVQGGLYIDPNPGKVSQAHPTAGSPTRWEKKRYLKNAVSTRVHTHTDSLDAWVYYKEGSSLQEVPKPAFASVEYVLKIVDFLHDGHKPGWLRFGADLLNLSSEAQKSLAQDIKRVLRHTRRDDMPHTMCTGYAGTWGFPTLFVQTQSPKMAFADAKKGLTTYMAAKRYQMRSDRALGLLMKVNAEIVCAIYMNSAWVEDPSLDELGETIGLQPVGRMSRSSRSSASARKPKAGKKRRSRKRR